MNSPFSTPAVFILTCSVTKNPSGMLYNLYGVYYLIIWNRPIHSVQAWLMHAWLAAPMPALPIELATSSGGE
jgi:hypothetical protein